MKLRRVIPIAVLLVLTTFALAQTAPPPRPSHYHVDYDRGSDENSGLSPTASWKHAPGDPKAEARPKATRLNPGDRVTFAADTVYRGSIIATHSGTSDAPIVYEGAAGKLATISGSEPVEARPCSAHPSCTGLSRNVVLLQIDRQAALSGTIFDGEGAMRLAQSPNPADAQYPDEPASFLEVESKHLTSGELLIPFNGIDCPSNCGVEIAFWVHGNVVVTRPVLSIMGGVARFDPNGLKFYTGRKTRYALRGLRQFLDEPGEYLPVGSNLVLAIPRGTKECCFLATGRGGFRIRNASWITIRNLGFVKMADANIRGNGIAVFTTTPGIVGLTISGNRFRHFDLRSGAGVINLHGVSNLIIEGNQIEGVVRGSGLRISGPSQHTTIKLNRIERIGRTAIYISGARDVEVSENFIADVKGVHGNGLTAYLGNQRVAFRRNTVLDAKQPATFSGSGEQNTTPHDLVFEGNLLMSTDDSHGSLISWGNVVRGVTISENVLLGGRFGLRPHKSDQDVSVHRNFGMPPAPTAPIIEPPGDKRNRWLSAPPSWEGELLRASRARAVLSPNSKARICNAIKGSASSARAVGANLQCP